MTRLHDALLQDRLIFFELQYLFLHMVVLSLLLDNGCLEVSKVLHDVGVDNFNVFIVLS